VKFATRKLSARTWPDFERLFARHNGVQAGCWCMCYHRARPVPGADRERRNREDKEDLVRRGRSHGILVYAGNQAVGWCQYGPQSDLPRIDSGRNYARLGLAPTRRRLGRITCFFIDRDFRRQVVARIAMRAALASIRRRGSGTVEAYPATNPRAVAVWFGTVGMFRRERFRAVARLGQSSLLMRRNV
jgi:GNAT superfamily N-acetyltransferase